MSFWTGTPARMEQFSNLSPQQEGLQNQLTQSAMGGDASAYYRDLLGGNQTYNAMAAPEMRQFREETMPGIAEQFAGMGAGGSFGGNFQSATAQAGAGLAERLASLRAQLRQQGAQGMMGMTQQALSPYMQNVQFERTPGAFETAGKLASQVASIYAGGAAGGYLTNKFMGSFGKNTNNTPGE